MGLKVQGEMTYLGTETKTSGKGTEYNLSMFLYQSPEGVPCIYNMFVKGDRLQLITTIAKLKPQQKVLVTFDVISYNNKAEVVLLSVEE